MQEIQMVLSDFSHFFQREKFDALQKILPKQLEMSKDSLGGELRFFKNMLRKYNQQMTLDEFVSQIQQTSPEKIQEIYEELQHNWPRAQIVTVSNQEQIRDLQI
jgi:predicted Zn-dependent peptidase